MDTKNGNQPQKTQSQIMPRPKRAKFVQPDAPALIQPDHAKVRVISVAAGAPKAWARLSPLESAFAKGQLIGGSKRYTANQRFEAGSNYAQLFLVANGAGGRDSTQALNVSQSGAGYSIPQSALSALSALAAVETSMGARDCRIIRRVCGEGHKPVDAIRDICADYQHTVPARFREALDSLVDAFERTRGDNRQRKAS